jgi:hypothetical protein
MIEKSLDFGLSAVRKITDLWAGAKAESLIDYTQVARVEPIVLIDTAVLGTDLVSEVMQSMLSIVSGYYLQAVAISLSVGKIEVMRHLDKLNPRRNPGNSAANTMGYLLATESFQHSLPYPGQEGRLAMEAMSRDEIAEQQLKQAWAKFDFDTNSVYDKRVSDSARDAKRDEQAERQMAQRVEEAKRNYELNKEKMGHDKAMAQARLELEKDGLALRSAKPYEVGFGRDTMSTLKELSNLSVGKMLNVEITDGANRMSLPVAVRLMASSLPSENLVHILSVGSEDKSFRGRWDAWRSGAISGIKDFALCLDLVEAHKKNLLKDKTGIYSDILKRNRSNQLSALFSGNPSIATASNMCVIDSETVKDLELKAGGKFSNFTVREKIFKNTYMMLIAVIDRGWDRVTFYHRGINAENNLAMRDLKASNKGNGPDVGDILRAYQVGNAPSL